MSILTDVLSKSKASPYFNHEGYADPTAYHGIKNVTKEEKEVHDLVQCIRNVVNLTDFEIVGRVELRNKKSGRIFK